MIRLTEDQQVEIANAEVYASRVLGTRPVQAEAGRLALMLLSLTRLIRDNEERPRRPR